MVRSLNFTRTVFHDQTPALARAFANTGNILFVNPSSSKARIDVYTAASLREVGQRRQERARASNVPSISKGSVGDLDRDWSLLESQSLRDSDALDEYAHSVQGTQVYFIPQQNSYSPLSISQKLFDLLCLRRNVSPQFRDYILYLGKRECEIEIAPPALRMREESPFIDRPNITCECMFGLRFVEPNFRIDVDEPTARWSLRQSAVYFQATGVPRAQTWIFMTLPESCKERLNVYFSHQESVDESHLLEIYVLLVDTVMGNWRPYLVALSVETEQHASQLLGASPDDRSPISMADAGQRQTLMVLHEKLSNTILALQASKEDLRLVAGRMKRRPPDETKCMELAVEEKLDETERLILKAEALRSRIDGIALLVSSFLELSNGFALQQLGKESRRENEQMRVLSERMHLLAQRSTQDATAVKVLTIITLVYLPFTVVTNFFSTSFVGLSATADHIYVTRDWWILLACGVPLTLLTLYVWWVWSRIQAYRIWPWWWFRGLRRQEQPDRTILIEDAKTCTHGSRNPTIRRPSPITDMRSDFESG
ncbi:hypothetical protein LTS15_000344 [Exophiala xenobiotica]|nr:hypothetical protein LTS15_000344 [Exophiala xenobiotica]